MSPEQIIRAWKDEEYRLTLSDEEWALVPVHPAGLIELTDEELAGAAGMSRENKSSRFIVGQWAMPGELR
jgi:mersacidin/lichenicidin family type 2 lantibiotic